MPTILVCQFSSMKSTVVANLPKQQCMEQWNQLTETSHTAQHKNLLLHLLCITSMFGLTDYMYEASSSVIILLIGSSHL